MYRPSSPGGTSKGKLSELFRNTEKNSILVGDFNLSGVDWDSGVAHGEDDRVVLELRENSFSQLVDFKNHIRGRCLDLVSGHYQYAGEGEQCNRGWKIRQKRSCHYSV